MKLASFLFENFLRVFFAPDLVCARVVARGIQIGGC
jgi:hypothetical protein